MEKIQFNPKIGRLAAPKFLLIQGTLTPAQAGFITLSLFNDAVDHGEFITVPEAAKSAQVTRWGIRDAIDRGVLQAMQVGEMTYIHWSWFNNWMLVREEAGVIDHTGRRVRA